MNRVILVGNLTRDPELTTTNSGIQVCRFALAVQRRFSNTDGERGTDFINIVVWRQQAENCHRFLKKGSKCAVVGRLQISSYEAQDGSKRYSTDVVADEVEFLTSKSQSEGGSDYSSENTSSKPAETKQTAELEEIDDDSLPF